MTSRQCFDLAHHPRQTLQQHNSAVSLGSHPGFASCIAWNTKLAVARMLRVVSTSKLRNTPLRQMPPPPPYATRWIAPLCAAYMSTSTKQRTTPSICHLHPHPSTPYLCVLHDLKQQNGSRDNAEGCEGLK
jgi:hypothetical protein